MVRSTVSTANACASGIIPWVSSVLRTADGHTVHSFISPTVLTQQTDSLLCTALHGFDHFSVLEKLTCFIGLCQQRCQADTQSGFLKKPTHTVGNRTDSLARAAAAAHTWKFDAARGRASHDGRPCLIHVQQPETLKGRSLKTHHKLSRWTL